MTSDQAARYLKNVLELQAQGATWEQIGLALHLAPRTPGKHRERAKLAKKFAKEAARVSQKTLAEHGIGFS